MIRQWYKSGDVSIAYQVLGNGPIDLVYSQGWITNVEYAVENPDYARFMMRLGMFSRLIGFDRRGMGLSDRDVGSLPLEERVDDIRAVMDAVGSERAALLGSSEGPGAKLVELPGEDHIAWWGPGSADWGSPSVSDRITSRSVCGPGLLTEFVTDIVGSTEKIAGMGDLKWEGLQQSHDAAVTQEVKNFDGQEINTTGDGLILAFAGPSRAIQCAVAIKQAMKRLGLDIRAGCTPASASGAEAS